MYAAFVCWLVLILGMGVGIYRLWSRLVQPAWINWAILPGTIVSEVAYVFACLITGGDAERMTLVAGGGVKKPQSSSKDKSMFRVLAMVFASLLAIVACAAAIWAARWLIGHHVMEDLGEVWSESGALPERLPTTWAASWAQLDHLAHLQRVTCEALRWLEWRQWKVTVFVYLSMCLAVRLVPVRGSARQTVAALLVVVGGVVLAAQLTPESGTLMPRIWPLLTYVWTGLLTLLLISLILFGVVSGLRTLAGKSRQQ